MIENIVQHISYREGDFYIRLIEKEDLERIRIHRNDYETWVNLTDTNLIYKEQQEVWYQKLIQDRTKKYFMVYVWMNDTEFPLSIQESVGIIRIDEIDYINRSARVGCDIFKQYRNKGYGKGTMNLVVKYCFEFLNMHRLWLLVAEYNLSAIKVYKVVGFKEEGLQKSALFRKGIYHDYVSMSIIKELK